MVKFFIFNSKDFIQICGKGALFYTMNMNHGICCECMRTNIEETGIVNYDIIFDEYGIKVPEDENSYVLLEYCPWCAKKLPSSKREEWFLKLRKLGFENPFEQKDIIPSEFKSDEWRRV